VTITIGERPEGVAIFFSAR